MNEKENKRLQKFAEIIKESSIYETARLNLSIP